MPKNYLITSAYSVSLNGETPNQIMFFPAGKSRIRANVNGKPKQISVNVDQKTAGVMQASLTELLKEPVEPFIDFNHKAEDSAAIPKAFTWKDGEGVMLNLEWTAGGESAIKGKSYRYFSPTFLLAESGEPSGLPDTGPIGALTNNPAFRRMRKISASDEGAIDGDDTDNNNKKDSMDKITAKLVALGLITAEDASEPEKVTAALDAYSRKGTENKELVAAQARIKALEADVKQQKVEAAEREADILIEGAVKEHKLAPKDEKAKAGLKKFFLIDAAGAKEYVESLPVNAAFKTIINHKVGDRDTDTPPGASHDAEIRKLILEIKASNKDITNEEAWNLAESRRPDLFGTSVVRATNN